MRISSPIHISKTAGAGAIVPLSATDLFVVSYYIQPKSTNVGAVTVAGVNDVSKAVFPTPFQQQGGGDWMYNLKEIYISPVNANEGVDVIAYLAPIF